MYKLLIVDDEPQILEGMKRTLDWEKYGFGHRDEPNV
jgi:YesN/AraC family two-component response regulator